MANYFFSDEIIYQRLFLSTKLYADFFSSDKVYWNRRITVKCHNLQFYKVSSENQTDWTSSVIKIKLIASINFYSSNSHLSHLPFKVIDLTFHNVLNNMNGHLFRIYFSNTGNKSVIRQQSLWHSFWFLFLKSWLYSSLTMTITITTIVIIMIIVIT